MLQVYFTSRPVDKLKAECIIATAFSDQRPLHGTAALLDWRLNGRLSRYILKHRFSGEFGESLLMPGEGRVKSQEIILVGLGRLDQFNESHIAPAIQLLLDKVAKKRVKDFLLSLTEIIPDRFEWRNSVRLLVSKIQDYPVIETVRLCETEDCVKDARRRHMDFGFNIDVSFETVLS